MADEERSGGRGAQDTRSVSVSPLSTSSFKDVHGLHLSANGVMDDPLVLLEVREIKAGIQLDEIGQNASWRAFLATPSNRLRLAVVILIGSCTQLAGNGVVQYYLVPVLKVRVDLHALLIGGD